MPIFFTMRYIEQRDYKTIQEIALTCFANNIDIHNHLFIAKFILKRYFREKRIQARLERGDVVIVHEENNQVVGFVEISKKSYIANLFVLPEYQKQGIGTRLLKRAEKYCGKVDITLDASTDAIPFYERNGYHLMEKMTNHFGVKLFFMKKEFKK